MVKAVLLKKSIGISVGALFCLFLFSSFSCAEISDKDLPNREGVKVGELIFHTGIKTGFDYDSNIYLTNTNRKDDTVSIVNPYIGFTLPIQDNSIGMEYDVTINSYNRFNENNHVDHRVQTVAEINLTDYKITLSDIYRRVTDRAGSENVNRTKRDINNFSLGVSTQLEKLAFDISYANKLEDYLTNTIVFDPMTYKDKSTLTHIFDIEASYRLFPKTSILWDNAVGFVDYYKSSLPPDSYYIESLLGVKGSLTNKILVNLRGGVRYQDYDRSNLIYDDKYCNFVARGGLDYQMTNDDKISLSLERSTYDSTYVNMNYYEVNAIGLNWTHKFYKVTAGLLGSYQFNDYPEESTVGGVTAKRKDDLYSCGFSLRYDIQKWFSLEGKYEYKKRDSEFATYDYKENLTTVRGTVGF